MEVRNFKIICMMLAVAGLLMALPLAAGEEPARDVIMNPTDYVGYQPTVPERDFAPYDPPEAGFNGVPTLTPSEIYVTKLPGDTFSESKILHMPEYPVPPKADIIFVLDLTGSMEQELENVKTSAIDIMTAIRGIVPDTYFAVISHMDYVNTYNFCQYNSAYGSGSDYPYSLDQGLTDDMTAVETAINGLAMGAGQDPPESYARALYECYSDAGVNWRAGTKKFIVQFGDNIPHDCDVYDCIGLDYSSGRDPGRNGIVDDGDDILIGDVISGLMANNICLMPLYSGESTNHFNSWDCWAALTGCEAHQINTDGTIPGGTDIAQYIADAIGEEFGHINILTLRACDPAWDAWIADVTPAQYGDVDLDTEQDFPFEIDFKVPDDAEPGEYCFDVCADGDGVVYAQQHVCVTIDDDDDCIHLWIGEIWGMPGEDVLVPVYIQDVTGWDIFAFETELCWCELPTGLIQYEGCLPGEVMTASSWGDPACGLCDENCVTVAGAGAGPLEGGGVLFYLQFHISLNAKPGMCCEICFEYADVYDPEVPLNVCLECGFVCIEHCGIGGSVYMWWCEHDPCCDWYRWRPLEGVRMHLSDCTGAILTDFTDGNGEFFFGDLPPMEDCDYCVDIDYCPVPDALITAYDASLVLQHVVCGEPLTACPFEVCYDQDPLSAMTVYPQQVAANVSCTGPITAYDASLILQYVIGQIPAFPCPDPWAWYIVNACTNCAPVCPFDFEFVGVFIGDVSGMSEPVLAAPLTTANAKIGIPRHYDNKVEVPLLAEDLSDVFSIEFDLRFNSNDFTVVDVVPAGIASSFMHGFNADGEDLFIAMAGSSPIYGSGRVAMITFQKTRPLIPTASPRVSISDGIFNEGNPEMVILDHDQGKEIWRLGLMPASPNPFTGQTALSFSLPEAADVMLAIYNVGGQLVRTLEGGQISAGHHRVTWDGTDDTGARVARGVYFCRMETAGFSATEKVVMLR